GARLVAVDTVVAGVAVGVPGGVGAALGDRSEECLRRERPVDARLGAQAVSGDSAHNDLGSGCIRDSAHNQFVTKPSDGVTLVTTPVWVTRLPTSLRSRSLFAFCEIFPASPLHPS